MSGKATLSRSVIFVLPLILLVWAAGCSSNAEKRLETVFKTAPEALSAQNPELSEKLMSFIVKINDAGLPIGYDEFLYLKPDRKNLGWKIHSIDSSQYVWTNEELEKVLHGDIENTSEVFVKKVYHLDPDNPDQTPISPALTVADDTELLLWLIQEGFRKIEKKDMSNPETMTYLGYKTVEKILFEWKGPASGELADLKAQMHDMITWASLVRDLVEQLKVLKVNSEKNPDADYPATRKRLITTWTNDFTFYYSDRFLTNRFLYFGEGIFSDTELFSIDTDAADWPVYSKIFEETGNDIGTFFSHVIGVE